VCGSAQSSTNEVRHLSLEDCIEMTLQQNITLQIARYNPQIAEFNLRGAYSVYDPTLFFSGERSHSEGGPTLLGTNVISGTVSDGTSFQTGLGGYLPWGMTYNLSGSAFDTDRTTGGGLSDLSNSGGSVGLGVTQPWSRNLWIDANRLNIRVRKIELTVSELALKQQIMTRITLVQQA